MARKKEPEIKEFIISSGILPEPLFLKEPPVFARNNWVKRADAGIFTKSEAEELYKKAKRIYHNPQIIKAPTGN